MKQSHTHTLNDHTAGKQLDTHWRVDSSTYNTVIISVIIIIINASCKLVGGGVQVGVCPLKLCDKTKQKDHHVLSSMLLKVKDGNVSLLHTRTPGVFSQRRTPNSCWWGRRTQN